MACLHPLYDPVERKVFLKISRIVNHLSIIYLSIHLIIVGYSIVRNNYLFEDRLCENLNSSMDDNYEIKDSTPAPGHLGGQGGTDRSNQPSRHQSSFNSIKNTGKTDVSFSS